MAALYGNNFTKTRVPKDMVDVSNWHGRVRLMSDVIEVPITAANDTISVAKLPSNAVLLPISTVYFDDLDIADMDFGGVNDPDGLAAAIDMATAAGNSSLMTAVAIENYGKKLWELLGYTADPKTQLDLFFTVNDIGAAGSLSTLIYYTVD